MVEDNLLFNIGTNMKKKKQLQRQKRNRFFIVFYIGTRKSDNAKITGFMDFSSERYLNKQKTVKQILKKLPEAREDIVITNIIELSKEDMEAWQYCEPEEQ